jgi:hypothetical protein
MSGVDFRLRDVEKLITPGGTEEPYTVGLESRVGLCSIRLGRPVGTRSAPYRPVELKY